MSTRQDFVTAISSLVYGNKFPIGETEKILAVNLAVKEHSKNKPKVRVVDVTGADTFEYKITTYLTYWKEGFSKIQSVEYDVDDTDEDPDMVDSNDILIYRKADGEYLRFLDDEPSTTESFRVKYIAPHIVDDSSSTIDYFDEEAVQILAASYFCAMLSTAYSSQNDSTINADSVDHKSKAKEFENRTKMYRDLYHKFMGIKEGESLPVSVNIDWDMTHSWNNEGLTHYNRYR